MESADVCFIDEFPDELVIEILSCLSPYVDTLVARRVCKRWLRLLKTIEEQNKDEFVDSIRKHNITWRTLKPHTSELPSAADGTNGNGPSPRCSHGAIRYGRYMYVFGGVIVSQESGTTYKDFHALDLLTYQWKEVNAQGDIPSKRCSVAFLADNGRLIMQGGLCQPSFQNPDVPPRFFDTTHEFDIATSTWKKFHFEHGTPSVRASTGISMVKGEMVMFGGCYRVHQQNDVWLLNFDTLRWRMCKVVTRRPPERSSHSQWTMPNDLVMVFGGVDDRERSLNDIWLLDIFKRTWTQVRIDNIPHQPRNVSSHPAAMMHDHLVVFSDEKMCDYCGNFLVPGVHVVPESPPEDDAERCTCGYRKEYGKPENLRYETEFTHPVYMQMYVLDISKLWDYDASCKWLDYHPMSPTPMSRRMFTSCAGVNEIIIFGGIEESKPHLVDGDTIIVKPKIKM